MIILRKKPIFSIEDSVFTIRAINTATEFTESPQIGEALNRLMFECEQDTNKRFAGKMQNLHTREELARIITFDEEWSTRTFTGGNQTVFAIETGGELACTMLIRLNDPAQREALKVDSRVGSFVYVGDVITEEKFKGMGIFSKSFDKLITLLSNPKRELATPIVFSISMTNAEILKDDGGVLTHPMNYPIYAKMWQDRLLDNKMQIRLQHLETKVQEGVDRFDIERDNDRLSALLDFFKIEAAKDGKKVRGAYIEGIAPAYEVSKERKHTPKPSPQALEASALKAPLTLTK